MGLTSYLHSNPFLTVFAIASFLTLILFIKGTKRPKDSPPGPPTLPIIGNIHQLPLTRPFIKFREWARTYGGLYSIKIGPQTIVMVSDTKALKDLYEKRGAIYSSRPHSHIGGEIVCPNETHILFMPYGERARNYRHAYNTFMGPQQGDHLRTIQAAEANKLLRKLLLSPERYYEHICCNLTAVILESHYGIFPEDYEDWVVKEAWRIQREWMKIIALGATPPIDAFPFLRALPDFLSPWRIQANSFRKEYRKYFYGLLKEGKARIAEGKTIGSFLEKLLQDEENFGIDGEHLMYFSATLVEAGSGTSASSMLSFLLACVENNEILKKAQEDVDRVCGTSRSPDINDRDSMPYIRACVNEVLRWRPALPFSVPRQLTEDDNYEGYFFPKGTIFFQLTWAMNMDENVYENPEIFNPDRYIQNRFGTKFEASKGEESWRKEQYAFGVGRKACPGERFGRDALFVIISKLVWAFNVTSPTDPKTGKPMAVDTNIETAYTDGLIATPLKFPANFTIRSGAHRETIEREALLAEEVISKIRKEA